MLKNMLGSSYLTTESKNKLFDVISDGVTALVLKNISSELLKVWLRYAISALEFVDSAYKTCYAAKFLSSSNENSNLSDGVIYKALSLAALDSSSEENRKILLGRIQILINILKELS